MKYSVKQKIILFCALAPVVLCAANSFAYHDDTGGTENGNSASSNMPITSETPTDDNAPTPDDNNQKTDSPNQNAETVTELYTVLSVTDGDTIRIDYDGTNTPVRLIGIDTPETVDSRKVVQCFGQEASDYLKAKLAGQKVALEADPTQSNRDKYDRLLRYVYLDGEDVGLSVIANGYGHEYTYNIPYQKQTEYQNAEKTASAQNLGLWSPSTCNGDTAQPADNKNTDSSNSNKTKQIATSEGDAANNSDQTTTVTCNIKGNISNKGEKIYHVPGQQYYDKTVITPSKGERMFCTEQEAVDAGWRKSKV